MIYKLNRTFKPYCATQLDSSTYQNRVICCSLGILKFVPEFAIQTHMGRELSEKKRNVELELLPIQYCKGQDCGKGFQLAHDICSLVIRRACRWISPKRT